MRNGKTLLLSILLAAVAFFAGSAFNASNTPITAQAQQEPQVITFEDEGALFAALYDQVSPSVVSINVVVPGAGNSQSADGTAYGTGSGFVIDTQGHIVTNNHVVQGASDIEVNFFDGTIVRGEIVGEDPNSDIAVIRVDLPANELFPVTFADSDALDIGETTLAIGSPFGERWTLTSGIVSALGRTIPGLTNYSIGGVIQTDASINPGNSGGPLLNLQGQVIGVNSQIESQSGTSSGIGFAVPSNLVQRVAAALIAQGFVDYSYLGIQGGDISLEVIEALNLDNSQRGVVVSAVQSDSPAQNAGLLSAEFDGGTEENVPQSLRNADIITAIDGTLVDGMGELISYLANYTQPGQQVTLTVLRDGQSMDITVLLEARPGSGQRG